MPQHETEVLSAVRTLMLSIKEKDLHSVKSGTCNASCIRFYLAKLLRLSGHNAAVCSARWQGSGKVPGGDNEYIDIIMSDSPVGQDDRLIIDIDFRSHFEIARAVDSYQRIMESLPVVYVGTVARLNQFLQVMVDAAKFSLKQNSMPLPPWRSLNYLQSKWLSPYKRHLGPINQEGPGMFSPGLHRQCAENLMRLQFALHAEQEAERFSGTCNASCIRFYLAKLLRLSGYNAAVCSARWQGTGKVPGGDNEYVDIILSDTPLGQDDRLIIDIDFRSHFEIARAVDSYQRIMESLPVVYVGTVARLNQFLQVMVDAAKFSLKQNSMPLPPWRSLNYLQSKWLSPYKRHLGPINQEGPGMFSPGLHKQCAENLKGLQFALHAEQEAERFVKKKKKSRERIRIHGAP
ncbi:hypothetical protein F2Q68_00001698 [Brassica cretica]|uniref:Uncharacterized protein n=1 Tax=Brassica cretica TaxID=69181 RepID=A0A8S9J7V8_BRACR|nr:hypothetical protein F2Q68_00001698 [Brassica cretica]